MRLSPEDQAALDAFIAKRPNYQHVEVPDDFVVPEDYTSPSKEENQARIAAFKRLRDRMGAQYK